MCFVDMYDCHSERISHIYSSRWMLQSIKVNKTLLGIAQIIKSVLYQRKNGWMVFSMCLLQTPITFMLSIYDGRVRH